MNKNWQNKFIELAKQVGSWSKDPSRKIGAVIVDPTKHVLGIGYNGFPTGIKDTDKRLNNKEFKRSVSLHAEESAILNARRDLTGCSIFIYGLCCCSHCASWIIQTGIKEVYYKLSERGDSEHWKDNIALAKALLKEAGVKIKEIK